MATIITKNSSTTGSVPLNTQLVQGELAVNVTDKRLFTENASGTVVELGTNPSTLVTSNTFLAFGRGNTEDMRLTSTGLGIGTSSPTSKLQVQGLIRTSSSAAGLQIDRRDTSASAYTLYSSAGNLQFYNGTSDVMVLDSSGNLGLGVTPSAWGSAYKALQLAAGSFSGNAGAIGFEQNAFHNGTNWIYRSNGAASHYETYGGGHYFFTAPSGTAGNAITFTQAMTLDASGNLLVGNTSLGNLGVNSVSLAASSSVIRFTNTSASNKEWTIGTSTPGVAGVGDYLSVGRYSGSAWAEYARIDSSGNLLVGKTSADEAVPGVILSVSNLGIFTRSNGDPLSLRRNSSDGAIASFRRDATLVGTISVTTSATAYNTSSDYRLKEDIQPMTGALAKVAALKPCTYKWKADGSDGEGFIAHELAEVVPQCVTGEKDAVDADGNPVYQGIDTSFLVATLTAAIQELTAQVNELKADVAALKGAA